MYSWCILPGGDLCSELKKRFSRSFLDLLVLHMVTEEHLWGYRIMSLLHSRYEIRVGPPVIYPLLDSMEKKGLLESDEIYKGKRRRRVYRATPEGLGLIKCFKVFASNIFEDN
jgi:PadR family transcriptional regulator PadR